MITTEVTSSAALGEDGPVSVRGCDKHQCCQDIQHLPTEGESGYSFTIEAYLHILL